MDFVYLVTLFINNMVRQCQFCKKLDYMNPEKSFHRFPVGPLKRELWCSLLGFEEGHKLPKTADLCSDHFYPHDIHTRANGLKYLRSGAIPKVEQKMEHSSFSSDSTLFDSPPRKPLRFEAEVETNKDQEPVAGPSNLMMPLTTVYERGGAENPSSSVTETASETENILTEQTCGFVKKPLSRKRRYIGELHSSDFSTPEKRRKNLNEVKKRDQNQRTRIHNLQMAVRRLRMKVTTLKSLLDVLKQKSLISENSESTITASLPGPALDIFERMLKGPSKQKYSPALRSFALTLSFYSPRAYNFVRTTFNKTLPHLGTISKWYKSVDGSPGFTQEALLALSLKQKESSAQLLCNLVMDEMSIRRQIEWTGQKFTGYVDIGTNIEADTLPEAREALVFMLVCLNGAWKIPVGYFLIDGLSAVEKAGLVQKCLTFVHDSGVIVTSLTFDGAPTNMTMAQKLGADFTNVVDLKTSFKHPVTNEDIYVFFDPCHMIKLVRNCLASQQELKDHFNHDIKWKYLEDLVDTQNTEGLHAATKMRLRHLQWEREKMKVCLATQTISRSVSNAITFLREDLKHETFQHSEGTSEFLLNFNNLFDIFNSRNRFSKYIYKQPFSANTEKLFLDLFQIMKCYIMGITLKGRPIINSLRKTGFLGFLICIESIQKLYSVYVKEKKLLKYILTYKLSQDHLEQFFGSIRSRGGYNNNPTARQMEAAYKRLLVHTQVRGPATGNTTMLENIPILHYSSSRPISNNERGENLEEDPDYLAFLQETRQNIEENYLVSNAWDLTIYVEDVVAYISGFVVKSLKKCIGCHKCLSLLENDIASSNLQQRKAYGRLIKASSLVVDTCKAAEKFFRFFNSTQSIFNKKANKLIDLLTLNTLKDLPSSVFDSFGDHAFDEDALSGHTIQLLKSILKHYFNLRIHHETVKSLDRSRKNRSRSINTKLVLFRNE